MAAVQIVNPNASTQANGPKSNLNNAFLIRDAVIKVFMALQASLQFQTQLYHTYNDETKSETDRLAAAQKWQAIYPLVTGLASMALSVVASTIKVSNKPITTLMGNKALKDTLQAISSSVVPQLGNAALKLSDGANTNLQANMRKDENKSKEADQQQNITESDLRKLLEQAQAAITTATR